MKILKAGLISLMVVGAGLAQVVPNHLDTELFRGSWLAEADGREGAEARPERVMLFRVDKEGMFWFTVTSAGLKTAYRGRIIQKDGEFFAEVILAPVVEGASRSWRLLLVRKKDAQRDDLVLEFGGGSKILLKRINDPD